MHARKVDVPLSSRLAFSLAEVSALTGFSPAFIHELMKRGRFHTHRVGRRRIATPAAVAELLGVSCEELFGPNARRQQPVAPAHPRWEKLGEGIR
jgi:hypothetical protein